MASFRNFIARIFGFIKPVNVTVRVDRPELATDSIIKSPTNNNQMSTNPNAHLTLSPAGIAFIHSFESLRLTAYDDLQPKKIMRKGDKVKGTMTIGWGTTRYEDGSRVQIGDVITKERADKLFDLIRYEKEDQLKKLIKVPLAQNQFDAVVSFLYNAGSGYYDSKKVFHYYNLWQHINNRLSGDAMRKYWTTLAVTSGGRVLDGLKRRRQAEVSMYLK